MCWIPVYSRFARNLNSTPTTDGSSSTFASHQQSYRIGPACVCVSVLRFYVFRQRLCVIGFIDVRYGKLDDDDSDNVDEDDDVFLLIHKLLWVTCVSRSAGIIAIYKNTQSVQSSCCCCRCCCWDEYDNLHI